MFGLTFTSHTTSQRFDIAGVMAVTTAIAYCGNLTETDISVTHERGLIYLDGVVSSMAVREEAQKVANEVTGSPIRNRLRVAS
ncbi:BON domain-containing protein [Ensifer sp. HO-A22]|uniref:BON domain-containing protein n=1 Tax=Ensifer oleiphilus TaxID=2742698 RepID=A0A7Y6QBX6_9HYPH|nr:BON domain-containing protein [Ensifer oleiphilus]NVD42741.1 BON domain-containing protein [Ensifer oleiphilus]